MYEVQIWVDGHLSEGDTDWSVPVKDWHTLAAFNRVEDVHRCVVAIRQYAAVRILRASNQSELRIPAHW